MPEDPKPPKPRTVRPLFDTVFGVGGNGQPPATGIDSPVPETPQLPKPPMTPRLHPSTVPSTDAPTEPATQRSSEPSTTKAAVEVVDLRETLAKTDAVGGLSALLRRFGAQQRLKPPWLRLPWIAFAVLVVSALTVLLLATGSTGAEDAPATSPPAASSPTTVANATTTTILLTTTVPPTTPPPIIEPVGDGLDLSELTLWTSGLGSLRTGGAAQTVLGVLAASLGQPSHDSGTIESAGEFGTCASHPIRTVQWGSLVVIVAVLPDGAGLFHGYAVDARLPDAGGPTAELQTVDGLKTGDNVARLQELYETRFALGFTIDLAEGPIYEIRNADGVLLWGPVTTTEPDGIVEGIFSPAFCAG